MASEDREYCQWLRQQPCAMQGNGDCLGAVHVHHAQGGKSLSSTNHDDTGKPLCVGHHTQRHALSGPFKGFTKPVIREWERTTAERYRREYLGLGEADSF